jgi:major membrane immunogen (membrane-anchored lipoprotein)
MPDSIDGGLLSMAQEFSGLPMGALIGGPLQAAAEAQRALAMTQTAFILSTGFTCSDDGTYTPVVAKIAMSEGTAVITDGKVSGEATSHMCIDFPIITMVPIPALAITSVDITFDMEVKSSYTHDTETKADSSSHDQGSFDAKAGWGCFSVEVKGSISHDSSQSNSDKQSYQKSNDAKYHVEVKAEQQALPDGIKTILALLAKNRDPIIVAGPAPRPKLAAPATER